MIKTQNQVTDGNTPVLIYSTSKELQELFTNLLTAHFPQQNETKITSTSEPENISDRIARGILSGDHTRPVSKPFFNELRRNGSINAYPIGNSRRIFFKRSEILTYLASKSPVKIDQEAASFVALKNRKGGNK